MKPQFTNATKQGIDSSEISANAVKLINKLLGAGYEAYLVGGGVRDLLLGLHPKDFDICTNARPEEIVKVFPRSRIIGRRFRIVHVYFGREIIEVTTFRGHHPDSESDHPHAIKSNTGQLLRDNIYGSVEEDAIRRDFTINSLYYDLSKNQILDYTGGLEDIKQRKIRIIGDPAKRYREDPVRMLRAIRFAAKLDFKIDTESSDPIFELSDLLNHIPSARLFDEFLKLFLSGYSEKTFHLMQEFQLFEHLFPETNQFLNQESEKRLLTLALQNTDQRIAEEKGVTPAFLLAVLLWSPLQNTFRQLTEKNLPPAVAMQKAAQQAISNQIQRTSIPRRFSLPMRDIWHLQLRLSRRNGQRAEKLLALPRFRAAYDFLLLREQSGEKSPELEIGLGQWWTDYQQAGTAQRKKMVSALQGQKTQRRRRRPKPKPKCP